MGRSSATGEKSSLLASTSGSTNGRDRDAHRGGGEEEKESTFQYLSSIVVSALALTGAVVGVASVWQRCQNGNCNPGSFLLPGDHRYNTHHQRGRFLLLIFFFVFVFRVLSLVVWALRPLLFFFLSLCVRVAQSERRRFIFIAKLTTVSTIIS